MERGAVVATVLARAALKTAIWVTVLWLWWAIQFPPAPIERVLVSLGT